MIMRSKHAIFLIAALLAAHATSAFDNEPDGFRGIAWQSAFEDFADEMKFKSEFGDGERISYLRDNDKMFIGEIPLKRVVGSGCDSLFDAFVDRFGEPSPQLGMAPKRVGVWTGLKTQILFRERSCGASLSSAVIIKEQKQLREAAEAEAKAKAKALREADKRPDF